LLPSVFCSLTPGLGRNKKHMLTQVMNIIDRRKEMLLWMGLRKGFATLNAIAVTTYWNDETMKSTVSS